MNARRKQGISVRFDPADLEQIQQLAARLGTSESEVIRYSVRRTLTGLGPVLEPQLREACVLPALVDQVLELVRHFRLDARRLESLLQAEGSPPIDPSDAGLLLLAASEGLPASGSDRDGLRARLLLKYSRSADTDGGLPAP